MTWQEEKDQKDYDNGYDAGFKDGKDCKECKFNNRQDKDYWKRGYYYGYLHGHNTGGRD